MNEFTALRREAKAKRDDALVAARAQYERDLAAIAEMEAARCGRPRHKFRGTMAAAIPLTGEFNQQDFVASLKAMYPEKTWSQQAVRQFLHRMRSRGVLRRVSKMGMPGVYVCVVAPENPRQRLRDAAADLLAAHEPLSVIEICVRLLESGYKTRSSRRRFKEMVFKELRGDTERFKRQGDKWEAVA